MSHFSRRTLVTASTAALVVPYVRSASPRSTAVPAYVEAQTETGFEILSGNGRSWSAARIEVDINADGVITVSAPGTPIQRVHLRWLQSAPPNALYLGDDWERSYGTLGWRSLEPDRIMPWYFVRTYGKQLSAYGVSTGANSFCFWQADSEGISLWIDLRNGGGGVQLGARKLHAATVITATYQDKRPFQAVRDFCSRMCSRPLLPAAPIYGGNNWYYAYGNSSADAIRADSERIASVAPSGPNRPFMVIDDGWSPNATSGPWNTGNARFPDMQKLAGDMAAIGVQPGLWMRPLFTKAAVPEAWILKTPNAAKERAARQSYTLDPSLPEVLQQCSADMKRAVAWGYRLVKHDFSTYDVLGRWGFSMQADLTESGWHFSDRSRTTAEILLGFYRSLREAAGQNLIIGCNTVGHLSAGLFEAQRTGDDTSGRDWNRVRKMGINTLGFRATQQGTFYAVDADCVGLTKQIPWELNRQWLDLLARSGTPLFVSAAPDALGTEQKAALSSAFRIAAQARPVAEPLDWMNTTSPEHWRFSDGNGSYRWFGRSGNRPFSA